MEDRKFIPSGWSELTLGDFLIPTIRRVEKPSKKYTRLGIRSHGKGTFLSNVEDPDDVAMDFLYEIKRDDLIVNITFAWEGAIAIAKEKDQGALVSHRFPTYVFNRSIAIPEYFQYVILSRQFFYMLGTISPGGAGRNRVLSKKDFLKLRVLIPPIEEQLGIAEILNTWDKAIALTINLIAAKQQLKKGLMNILLEGNKRCPGFEIRKGWKTIPNGRIPKDWDIITILELGKNNINTVQTGPFGAQLHASDYVKDGIPLVLIRNIENNRLNSNDIPRISEYDAERLKKYALKKNDIVFSRVGRVGSCFLATEEQDGWIISGQTLRIRLPVGIINFEYLSYALQSERIHKHLSVTSVGSTRQSINTKILESASIYLPCMLEQQQIASCLKTSESEIDVLAKILKALMKQKKILMQKLLTGQVRVSHWLESHGQRK
jgi:type I restriction enzyme S subunit